jgi:hypothetical protein
MNAHYKRLHAVVGANTVTSRRISAQLPLTRADGETDSQLAGVMQHRKACRVPEFRLVARLAPEPAKVGLAEWIVIAPPDENSGSYTVELRQLWFGVNSAAMNALDRHGLPMDMTTTTVSLRAELLEAVTTLCEYPASLLRAPIEQVNAVLDLQKQFKLTTVLGCFRRRRQPEPTESQLSVIAGCVAQGDALSALGELQSASLGQVIG